MKNSNATVKNIWMLTREYGDLAGAGGVKDVAAQLSRALARWNGRKVSIILPLYGFMEPETFGFQPLVDPLSPEQMLRFEVDMNYVGDERWEYLQVLYTMKDRVHIYLLDSPRFHEKKAVYTYTREEEKRENWKKQGDGHFDFFAMNLLLQKGALQLMLYLQERPDIIHCHDGHTALLPALVRETPWLRSYFRKTAFVVTIHNAGMGYHQDLADLPFAHAMTGLPWAAVMKSRLNGRFDPFIAAGHHALLNTVSENYARELQETEEDALTGWLGHHLLSMGVTMEGVTNGIDPADFNPIRGLEIGLGASFDPRDDTTMAAKMICKKRLISDLSRQGELHGVEQYGVLQQDLDGPLLTFIGRLSEQKGVDIFLATLRKLLFKSRIFQVVILGSGGFAIENELIELTDDIHGRGKICFLSGYNPKLANRVYGAGDFFIVPSRYEPCGLTDFIAQLFGNIPIVHHVGGLVKVVDGVTGFSYKENTSDSLGNAIERAMSVYKDDTAMRNIQKHAVEKIEKEHTWSVVMKQYLQLYKKAIIAIDKG